MLLGVLRPRMRFAAGHWSKLMKNITSEESDEGKKRVSETVFLR